MDGGCYITTNTLTSNSRISDTYITSGGSIINCFLTTGGTIINSTINGSIIGSSFSDNRLEQNSVVTVTTAYPVQTCTFINSIFNPGSLTNTLQNLNMNTVSWVNPLNTATDIYYTGPTKTIFLRKDGTPRLMYYNTTDTPTIVNVDN